MRVVEQYGMFTDTGDYMVDRIVRAGITMCHADTPATNREIWGFVKRECAKLATSEQFAEATDTVVREEVFGALWNCIPGFNLSESEYWA